MANSLNRKKSSEIKDIGRPTKFNPERCAAIVDAISHRIPYELAAEANGIAERTLYYWMDLGYQDQLAGKDTEYSDFLQSIKRAEMTRIREHSDIISARPERWQADAWMLERRWPKHYGNNILLKELNDKMNKMLGAQHDSRNEERSKEDDYEE